MTRSIYYTPNESATTSLMPESVIKSGIKVNGLEDMTGGDYLLSIYDRPLPANIRNIVPHTRLLRMHCGLYGVLIQRKSGSDFLASIPKLEEIFNRMFKWTSNPLLLITGMFEKVKGNVRVNKRLTEWGYSAYLAAKVSWQEKGGTLIELANDQQIPLFNNMILDRLERAKQEGWRRPLFSKVARVQPFDAAGMNTLLTFPNIGPHKAQLIYEYCGDNLYNSIKFITDIDAPDYFEIDGISKQGMRKIVKDCRAHMNFTDDWELWMVPRDSLQLEDNTNGKAKSKKRKITKRKRRAKGK